MQVWNGVDSRSLEGGLHASKMSLFTPLCSSHPPIPNIYIHDSNLRCLPLHVSTVDHDLPHSRFLNVRTARPTQTASQLVRFGQPIFRLSAETHQSFYISIQDKMHFTSTTATLGSKASPECVPTVLWPHPLRFSLDHPPGDRRVSSGALSLTGTPEVYHLYSGVLLYWVPNFTLRPRFGGNEAGLTWAGHVSACWTDGPGY